MNKFLLSIIAFGACAAPVYGAYVEPKLYDNASFQRISADGRYGVSELMGYVTIYDFQNGTAKVFEPDDTNYYGVGLGGCITADGSVIVGNTIESVNATYCDGKEWKALQVPSTERTNLANAITSDGSRICGSIGFHAMSLDDDVLMQAPVYWDRTDDGGYGEWHVLPYPEKDFYGETPQYITAIAISNDGKVIVGQVVDSRGMMTVPIVYTQGTDGEWSYSMPTENLFNPEGLEPVSDPGDGPATPSHEQFMTQEEMDAYKAAYDAWVASGYETEYPEYTDFMTEEELGAYQAAYGEWEKAYQEWSDKYDAFNDYYFGVLASSPTFLFNSELISGDGKTVAMCLATEKDDPMSWFGTVTVYTPWVMDLASGDVTKYESDKSLIISCLVNDGVVLAGTEVGSMPMEGYVLRDGDITNVLDYLNTISPEYTEWFKKNMTHEVLVEYVYNEEDDTWEEVFEELTYTGLPVATNDMKVMTLWNDASWDDTYSISAQGVMLDLSGANGGVDEVTGGSSKISIDAMGNLLVGDDVAEVYVYDLTGACVQASVNPAGTLALELEHGIYLVKAVHANGTSEVLKIAK